MINKEIKKALIRTNRGLLTIGEANIPVIVDTITEKMGEPTTFTIHSIPFPSEDAVRRALAETRRERTIYSSYYVGGVSESNVKIEKVIFNDPATIVLWSDGTKTVVKCQDGDIFDPEKGLAMAISKKAMGNKGNYCDQIKKWTEKYEPKPDNIKIVCANSCGASILNGFKKAVASAINAAEKFAASTESCKLKEPDMDTKREMLDNFCAKHHCPSCPFDTNEFTCGRGFSFKPFKPGDTRIVSEEEVNRAFKLAFPEFEGGNK